MPKQSKRKPRGPGRPRLTGDDAVSFVGFRCNVGFLSRVDAWRAKQPGKPGRSVAIRQLTESALTAAKY